MLWPVFEGERGTCEVEFDFDATQLGVSREAAVGTDNGLDQRPGSSEWFVS